MFEVRPEIAIGQPIFPLAGHTRPPEPLMVTELGAVMVIPAGAAEALSLNGNMGRKMEAKNKPARWNEDLRLNEPKTLQIGN